MKFVCGIGSVAWVGERFSRNRVNGHRDDEVPVLCAWVFGLLAGHEPAERTSAHKVAWGIVIPPTQSSQLTIGSQ